MQKVAVSFHRLLKRAQYEAEHLIRHAGEIICKGAGARNNTGKALQRRGSLEIAERRAAEKLPCRFRLFSLFGLVI